MSVKDIVLAAVREALQEHLLHQTSVDGAALDNNDGAALIAAWKAQIVSQVTSTYGSYYYGEIDDLQQEIETCMNATIQAWKEAPPPSSAAAATAAPSATTTQASFSLFASLGSGGLAAFFSWPTLAESENEDEIWQALLRVEYLEDAWPDWTTGIRPWIQARLLQTTQQGSRLCRTWYGKARQQASPETNTMVLDLMQDVFTAVDTPTNTSSNDNLTAASRQALLSVGLDMVLDHVTRQGIASLPPSICLVTLWKFSFDETLMDTLATRDARARWLHMYLQAHPTLYRQVGNVLDMTLLGNYLQQQQQQTHPDSLRQKRQLYVMAILSNLLILVRVAGLPWDDIATGNQGKGLVYQSLWALLCDATTPHRDLYVRGVEALLTGSSGQDGLRETFQEDWVTIQDQHALPELQPLNCFAIE